MSIENFVQAEATRASIPLDQIDISGPPGGMAKRWRVSFLAKIQGTPTLAARRVNLIFNNLKDESGQWRPLSVTAPSGSSVQLFLNRDINGQKGMVERCTKFLKAAVEHVLSGRSVSMDKKKGEVAVDWLPARVCAPSLDVSQVMVHPAGCRTAGVDAADMEAIRRRFRELSGKVPDEEWRL